MICISIRMVKKKKKVAQGGDKNGRGFRWKHNERWWTQRRRRRRIDSWAAASQKGTYRIEREKGPSKRVIPTSPWQRQVLGHANSDRNTHVYQMKLSLDRRKTGGRILLIPPPPYGPFPRQLNPTIIIMSFFFLFCHHSSLRSKSRTLTHNNNNNINKLGAGSGRTLDDMHCRHHHHRVSYGKQEWCI